MIRLHVICEGQTEETFVNELLRAHLVPHGVLPCPSLIGKPGHKGGNVNTERIVGDIRRRLLGDRTAYCTTFFDYYGLDPRFVGKEAASRQTAIVDKASAIEDALKERLAAAVGENATRRFIPYIQMHEFEGLLFSDPDALAKGLSVPQLTSAFRKIRSAFSTPEEINDSPVTAPSKRILRMIPEYDKPVYGSIAALEIGLAPIRTQCKRFDQWLTLLEGLGASGQPAN